MMQVDSSGNCQGPGQPDKVLKMYIICESLPREPEIIVTLLNWNFVVESNLKVMFYEISQFWIVQ